MKPLTYRILFLCTGLLLATAGLAQAQVLCRKFVQMSSGNRHRMAVAEDGTLWAWGSGSFAFGNVPPPPPPRTRTFVQVGTDQDWKEVEAGEFFTLALKTNGTLWAWGGNLDGQLGLGHTTRQYTPVQVGTDTDWGRLVPGLLKVIDGPSEKQISMALKTNGSLWFWGYDRYYQSGQNEKPGVRLSPTEAAGGTRDWKVVALGEEHTVALKANGTLWAWGVNTSRQVGHGATADTVKAPFQLGTATDWKTVAAGYAFNLAIKNDGTLWGWGDKGYPLGYPSTAPPGYQPIATQMGTDRDWKVIACYGGVVYALKNDGSLWTWGNGGQWTLGYPETGEILVPTRVGSSNDWFSVAVGFYCGMATKSDGSLWGVGSFLPTEKESYYLARIDPPATTALRIGLHGDARTLSSSVERQFFEKDCRLICRVVQTNNWGGGVRATGNSLTARVWVDDRTANHHVKRHYQITPAFNAATTTGSVSLYFTQEEFDEFNAVATNLKKLPTGPGDAAGRANLLIEKRSGVSADGSGSPASYSGTAENINPPDNWIAWDATYRRWEVTFMVTGFSGFWVKTTDRPLPVTFGSIAARIQGGSLWVDFTSEKETNNHHYEIEASTDGKTFKKIGELCSQAPDGNSDTPLSYTFKTAVSGIMGAAGIAGVVLLALAVGAGSRRRRLLPVAIVAISLWGAAACVKHSRESVAHHSPKIWVRIAQVDKDGTKEYSKIVQAVAKD